MFLPCLSIDPKACKVEVSNGFDLCLTLNKFVVIVVRLLRKEGSLISNQDKANILLLLLSLLLLLVKQIYMFKVTFSSSKSCSGSFGTSLICGGLNPIKHSTSLLTVPKSMPIECSICRHLGPTVYITHDGPPLNCHHEKKTQTY